MFIFYRLFRKLSDIVFSLLDYVMYTRNHSLVWPVVAQSDPFLVVDVDLEGAFDASLPQDFTRMASIQRVCGLTVSCRSKKQNTVSTSTTEAKLVAASFCARETLGQINFVREFLPDAQISGMLTGDNEAANYLCNSRTSLRNMKHLTLANLFVRDCTASGRLEVQSRSSVDLGADVATKVLAKQKMGSLLHTLHLFDL